MRPAPSALVPSLAALLLLAACGGDGGTPPSTVNSVSVAPATATIDAIGATVTLTATVRDQNGQVLQRGVTWTSSRPEVATVSSSGLVTAVAPGSATITATADGVSGSAGIAVDPAAATLTKLAGDAQTGPIGTALSTPVTVQVFDSQGNAIPGEPVSWVVTSGGGTVSSAAVTTDAEGVATTGWTLGNEAGQQTLEARSGNALTVFTATATPGTAEGIEVFSGNDQGADPGSELPLPIVARVVDAFGNGVPDETIVWETDDGSLNASTTTTGPNGTSGVRWTLADREGDQTARAIWNGQDTAVFRAVAIQAPTITGITPDTLIEGQTATINGTNFAADPASNSVLIDGVSATVTGGSTTQLTVVVPSFSCQPARGASVTVTTAAVQSAPFTHPVRSADILSLAVGQQQILKGQSSYCFQIPANAAADGYLFAVQSTGEDPNRTTSVRIEGRVAQTAFSAPGLDEAGPFARYVGVDDDASRLLPPALMARARRSQEHMKLLASLMEPVRDAASRPPLAAPAGPQAAIVDSSLAVGSQIQLRVRTLGSGCSSGDMSTVNAELKVKGTHALWFEDVANPAGGLTTSQIQTLANEFDNVVRAADVAEFGEETDLDGNGRIVILITKEINIDNGTDNSTLGFVNPCDLFPRASFAASNEGEFFYMLAPDPTGTHGQTVTVQDVVEQLPFVVAHEFSHIIQFSRRLQSGADFMNIFVMEGQATLAEEIAGHAVTGHAVGQNLDGDVAVGSFNGVAWYFNGFADLAFYYGANTTTQTKVPSAPEMCTWIDDLDDPCLSRPSWYGVTWSFLRWASDRFGGAFGGEANFQKALIDNTETGFDNFRDVLTPHGDFRDMLAQWTAALYVDDRVPGAAPELTFSSWDFFSVDQRLQPFARIEPRDHSFSNFTDDRTIRDPSISYHIVDGSAHGAMAIEIRNPFGGSLPAFMQAWIVRIQ